jgi:PAS domain S-box-containing protein
MNNTREGEGKPIKEREGVGEEIAAPRISETEHERATKELRRYRKELEALTKAHTVGLFRGSSKSRGGSAGGAGIPEELLESDRQLTAVFECAAEGILLADIRTKKFVYGNGTISRMLGYDPEEIRTLGVEDIHPKENLPHVRDRFEKLAGLEISLAEGIQLQRKDGSIFYADITSYPMKVDGRTYVTGIFRDVTKRRQTEEDLRKSEGKFRAIFDNTSDGIFLVDLKAQKFFMCNAACARMLGYTQGEFSNLGIADIHPKEDLPFIYREIRKFRQGKEGVRSDIRFKRKDGATFVADLSPTLLRIAQEEYLVVSFKDITERKRAEEALHASEQRFRALVETTSDFVWEVDQNCLYTYASPKIKDLLGYEPEEITGKRPFDFMVPDEAERVAKLFRGIAKSGKPFVALENTNVHKDGRRVVLETSGVPIIDLRGDLIGYRGIDRDITERKRVEEVLRKSEERHRLLAEAAHDMIFILDRGERIEYVNSFAGKQLGRLREEILGRSVAELFPGDVELQHRNIDRVFKTGQPLYVEDPIEFPNERIWVSTWLVPIKDEADQVTSILGISRDITERKRAEETLRKSEDRLREAQALGRIGSWEFEIDTRKIIWSDQVYRLYERDPALGPPTPEEEAAYYDPEQVKRLHEYARRAVKEGKEFKYDLQAHLPCGTLAYFSVTMRPVKDEGGRVTRLFGTVQDITERKRVDESLWEKERAIESSINGIAISDLDGNVTYANPACLRVWGYTKKTEVLGQNAADFWREPKRVARILKGLRRRKGWFGTLTAKRRDGSTFEAQVSASLVKGKTGKPMSLLAAFVDMTGQKRAEENYQSIFESAVVGIYQSTPKGQFLTVNPAFARILGYKCPREIIGMAKGAAQKFYKRQSRRRVFERLMKQHGEVHDFEFEGCRRDGRTIWIKENARVVRDSGGRVEYYEGFVEDITARKDAEESLKRAAQRIIEAQEAERKRIACDLHDGVSQLLCSAKFRLASVSEGIQVRTKKPYPELDDSRMLIEKSVQEIRRIIRNLRPAVLDNLGLVPALRALSEEFEERTNVKSAFKSTFEATRFAPQVELALFRIVQEALSNIEKHARATKVAVSLVQKEASVWVKVKDNGIGFDCFGVLGKNSGSSGYGLHTMMDRSASVGGHVKIRSAVGSGTEVVVRLRLNGSGTYN